MPAKPRNPAANRKRRTRIFTSVYFDNGLPAEPARRLRLDHPQIYECRFGRHTIVNFRAQNGLEIPWPLVGGVQLAKLGDEFLEVRRTREVLGGALRGLRVQATDEQ